VGHTRTNSSTASHQWVTGLYTTFDISLHGVKLCNSLRYSCGRKDAWG